MPAMEIIQANTDHAAAVAPLFDRYRQFYHCDPDPALALRYIRARLERGESTIFIATRDGAIHGFTQLYPSFCSVEAAPIMILYDLFVEEAARNAGVGALLMNRAAEFARQAGAVRVDLLTREDNVTGQHLYRKLGYERTLQDFHAYSLRL